MSEDKLKLSGELVKLLEVRSGTGKTGKAWTSQDFLVDTGASYNPEVCFGVFGQEKVDELSALKVGQHVVIYFNLKSNEGKNGGYFTSAQAWRIEAFTEESNNASNDASNDSEDGSDIPF